MDLTLLCLQDSFDSTWQAESKGGSQTNCLNYDQRVQEIKLRRSIMTQTITTFKIEHKQKWIYKGTYNNITLAGKHTLEINNLQLYQILLDQTVTITIRLNI